MSASHGSLLSIGQVSSRSGCKVPTIRYYEGIGLLPEPSRTEGGQRVYAEDAVKRLVFVRRSRELGFSLEEIRSLMSLSTDTDRPCAEVDSIARQHLGETLERLRDLIAVRDALVDLVDQCRKTTVVECRVINALSS